MFMTMIVLSLLSVYFAARTTQAVATQVGYMHLVKHDIAMTALLDIQIDCRDCVANWICVACTVSLPIAFKFAQAGIWPAIISVLVPNIALAIGRAHLALLTLTVACSVSYIIAI